MAITALELFGNSEQLQAQQWIPCKDRLPEEDDSVWISHVDGIHVFPVVYEPDRDFVWQNEEYCWRLSDAIAWMPRYMPEPYKEESNVSES